MKQIKVLGACCSACTKLFVAVNEVVEEMDLNAGITQVKDMEEICKYNVLRLPALIIDEKVASTGSMTKTQVKKLLVDYFKSNPEPEEPKKKCCCCG